MHWHLSRKLFLIGPLKRHPIGGKYDEKQNTYKVLSISFTDRQGKIENMQ
jgi:hypothetical protein